MRNFFKHASKSDLRAGFLILLVFPLLLTWLVASAKPQTNRHTITLNWTASTSAVTGYNVYRGTLAGGPYSKLNTAAITVTTFTDSTGTGGIKYFYVVTAIDASGSESANSNEASATFLGPPSAPTGLQAVPGN